MDRVEIINLFDVYETLLTDREKEIFKYYYYEDLSLSEIVNDILNCNYLNIRYYKERVNYEKRGY